MNGKPAPIVETIDQTAQFKQVIDLVKENKVVTALFVFVLWQTGVLLAMYTEIQGGIC